MKLEWFTNLWEKVKEVHQWYDKGKHFFANEFLYWKLIQLPQPAPTGMGRKIVLQFFEGGHGKTGWLDGAMFGAPGVGGVVADLREKERLRTTEQLMEACKKKRLDLQKSLSREEKK